MLSILYILFHLIVKAACVCDIGSVAGLHWFTDMKISLVAQRVNQSVCNVGDLGSIPGSGRSPGEENGD